MQKHAFREHGWEFESVRRTDLHKFAVMPSRWVVERTIGTHLEKNCQRTAGLICSTIGTKPAAQSPSL